MNRKELVSAVAAHTGLESRDVDKALRGLTEVIEAVAAKGEQVTISGFAKFARVDRPARMARNPATGEPVKVKASKKAKITPLKGFKDAVMSRSAAPKLAKGVWPPAPAKAVPAKKRRGVSSPTTTSPSKVSAARTPARRAATDTPAAAKAARPRAAKKTARKRS
ncbi:MAG TPA: HU family DNA-binding protein [Acidimicrobiales bacterium]|nr:HU family DNA-binding protein [Acidimicrobiales bacterium]